MSMCALLLYNWAILAGMLGTYERIQLQSLVEVSRELEAGASEEEVLALLGEPNMRWNARTPGYALLFGARPRQWIYGTTINPRAISLPQLPVPNPLPLTLRLFEPHPDDLVVNWSAEGAVISVIRPELGIPLEAVRLLPRAHRSR